MSCPISTDVNRAAEMLKNGKLVAFATETVYGLGAYALNSLAVASIFEAKGRPTFDPLIVHVANTAQLEPLISNFPEQARQLAEQFWPGPLTLVLPKTDRVPDLVTANLATVAVRIPDHPQALELLSVAGIPIAAPSANRFGQVSPTTAGHVADQLGNEIDLILDGGPCRVGVESTVLQLCADGPRLLRHGGVPLEQLEAQIGPIQVTDLVEHPAAQSPAGPGMLKKHYAPSVLVKIVVDLQGFETEPNQHVGLLSFQQPSELVLAKFDRVEILSPTGDLREAAAKFFSALRKLDAESLDLIVATPFPEQGLGRALNDRLQRAAS